MTAPGSNRIAGFAHDITAWWNKDKGYIPAVGLDSFVSDGSSAYSQCLNLQYLIRRRWIQLAAASTSVATAFVVAKKPLIVAAVATGLAIGLGRSIGELRRAYNALDCGYSLQFPNGEPTYDEQAEEALKKLYSPHEYAWVKQPAPVPLPVPSWQERGLLDDILESNRLNAEWMLYGSAAVALYGLAWFVTADDGIPRGPGISDNGLAVPATAYADSFSRAAAVAFNAVLR